MSEQISASTRNYLRAIYTLSTSQRLVSTSILADFLGIKPSSVTNMVQKLAKMRPPLVIYTKHQGVRLSDVGASAARLTVRHHQILELYLHRVLGYGWDEVHGEAVDLEMGFSTKAIERMADLLDDPRRGVHGHPIPCRNLTVYKPTAVSLTTLSPGETAVIAFIDDDDPSVLRKLASLHLLPDTVIQRISKSTPEQTSIPLQIVPTTAPIQLSTNIVRRVWVEPI